MNLTTDKNYSEKIKLVCNMDYNNLKKVIDDSITKGENKNVFFITTLNFSTLEKIKSYLELLNYNVFLNKEKIELKPTFKKYYSICVLNNF